MSFRKKILLLTAAFLPVLLSSCSSLRRYSDPGVMPEQVELSLPQEMLIEDVDDEEPAVVDSAEIQDGPLIMNAIRDSETGEMTATDVITASKVVARFRNIAERLGRISMTFDIIVPEALISSDFQLRFSPVMEMNDRSMALSPIFITGTNYRKRQLRGYERYRNFIASIVTDSSAFVRKELLETFIERYFPETYAMKTDSSTVPEPLAENLFGVNQSEALKHYTRHALKRRNDWKAGNRDRMFKKYVKAPIINEVKLDTVMSAGKGNLIYRYSHEMNSAPGLRKITVGLDGKVYRAGEEAAAMPAPEKLTFYISSLSTLADNTPRYVFKVVERIVTDNTDAFIDFAQGSTCIDTLSESNSSELRRIRRCFEDIYSKKHLVLDSIVVTASCSPEGGFSYNRRLAQGRAETVRAYVSDNIPGLDESCLRSKCIPENWEHLFRMVKNDSLLSLSSKETILAAADAEDKDIAEEKFAALPEYRYLREKIYPKLRTVNFHFYMHRPDMKKDTVHTTELDTVYLKGVAALKNLDYKAAAAILGPYGDYNSALAMASSGYNESALAILSKLKELDAKAEYLSAILLSRIGKFDAAAGFYRRSVEKDPAMRHRANLDPEMAEVLGAERRQRIN